jgi:hypothetical protein
MQPPTTRAGERRVELDPEAAQRAALELLARQGVPGQALVEAGAGGVQVTLRGEAQTTFLSLVGIRALPVAVAARAEPVAGEGGDGP